MWSADVVPVSNVHCDHITVMVLGPPEQHGFAAEGRAYCRGEWRAAEMRDRDGAPWTRATAEGAACYLGQVEWRWAEGGRVTRLDLCRDVVRAPLDESVLGYAVGHRGREGFVRSRTGTTLYIGSRTAASMWRLYSKAGTGVVPPPKHVEEVWRAHGWQGEPVTRCELELHTRALTGRPHRGLLTESLWQDLGLLWCDGVARVRLAARHRTSVKQACTLETAPGWLTLGAPAKEPRPRTAGGSRLHAVDWLANLVSRHAERLGLEPADVLDMLELAQERKKTS